MSQEKVLSARTLLQNSITILGDASTVGATNVAGLVGASFWAVDVDCRWPQSVQFESGSTIDCDLR